MGAPKGSDGDRLGRLCASNDHLHSTHIRNHRPRIKQIWICVSSEPTRSHHVRGPCPIFSDLIRAWVPFVPGWHESWSPPRCDRPPTITPRSIGKVYIVVRSKVGSEYLGISLISVKIFWALIFHLFKIIAEFSKCFFWIPETKLHGRRFFLKKYMYFYHDENFAQKIS